MFDSAGRCLPTKHNIHVDDNLLGEVKAYMHQALALGFESTFTIMGHPCPSVSPVPVNLDKLEELMVSPLQILLAFSKHTRDDCLHLGRVLQRGLGTSYSHLALPLGKFHSQGARIVSRQAWTHRPSLSPLLFLHVKSLLVPCLCTTRESSLPHQLFQVLLCTH